LPRAFEPIISYLIPNRSPRDAIRSVTHLVLVRCRSFLVLFIKSSGLRAFWASAPGTQSPIWRSRKRSVPVRVHSVCKSCGSQEHFRPCVQPDIDSRHGRIAQSSLKAVLFFCVAQRSAAASNQSQGLSPTPLLANDRSPKSFRFPCSPGQLRKNPIPIIIGSLGHQIPASFG
jgi:hypothetical protein